MSRSIFLTLIAFAIQSGAVFGQQITPAQKAPTLRMLLDDGWRITSHTIFQRMEDTAYQSNGQTYRFMESAGVSTSFVVEKAGKFALCSESYCSPLN